MIGYFYEWRRENGRLVDSESQSELQFVKQHHSAYLSLGGGVGGRGINSGHEPIRG